MMDFRLDYACISHIGTNRRMNEDNVFFNGAMLEKTNAGTRRIWTDNVSDGRDSVFAVFDGMGGEAMGELASFLAAKQLAETWSTRSSFTTAEDLLSTYADQANDRICKTMREERISRMGTTAALVYLRNHETTVMNIGDSRVYMLGENGTEVLSVDHTDESLMQQSGVSGSPKLTQHLGIFPEEMIIEPHYASAQIREGDRILICSDGLHHVLSNSDIADLLISGGNASDTANRMVNAALQKGSEDNVTVIVIDIKRSL